MPFIPAAEFRDDWAQEWDSFFRSGRPPILPLIPGRGYRRGGGVNGGVRPILDKKKGLRFYRNPFFFIVVAGAGFEPTTFGL
jgi:hypothetical protein